MNKPLDDLLRETLRARAADQAAACLDAERAAAFVDGTMSARARDEAEVHLADCPRCQALLGALVRTTPPPLERAWWRRPAMAWLAPLTAAATALAIWINVPDNASVVPVRVGARRRGSGVPTGRARAGASHDTAPIALAPRRRRRTRRRRREARPRDGSAFCQGAHVSRRSRGTGWPGSTHGRFRRLLQSRSRGLRRRLRRQPPRSHLHRLPRTPSHQQHDWLGRRRLLKTPPSSRVGWRR